MATLNEIDQILSHIDLALKLVDQEEEKHKVLEERLNGLDDRADHLERELTGENIQAPWWRKILQRR